MKHIIFDTETTDIYPGQICQIAYIIVDSEIKAKNFYFKVDYINPSAQRVHGLDKKMLENLSGNRGFGDFVSEIDEDFRNTKILYGHNVSFDINFLRKEFNRCGKSLEYSREFCTMKHFTNICNLKRSDGRMKYPKLEELIRFLNISQDEIMEATDKLFNEFKGDYHDARVDTAATYLCIKKARELEYIK